MTKQIDWWLMKSRWGWFLYLDERDWRRLVSRSLDPEQLHPVLRWLEGVTEAIRAVATKGLPH